MAAAVVRRCRSGQVDRSSVAAGTGSTGQSPASGEMQYPRQNHSEPTTSRTSGISTSPGRTWPAHRHRREQL